MSRKKYAMSAKNRSFFIALPCTCIFIKSRRGDALLALYKLPIGFSYNQSQQPTSINFIFISLHFGQ
jgi:hypothetical protein